jgi:pimeloyl-ACP methyl ester carboxylesterase
MTRARANGIELEYDSFGAPSGRPLLLIMGLGGQSLMWDEGFCDALAARGHFVVRYDNRDVGLSTKFEAAGIPNMMELMMKSMSGQPITAPYTLDDMADDAAGLLDALGIESAHVCGASMGGMIAQTVAIRHPKRLRSLVSIMSTTGNPSVPPAKPEAMAVLMSPPPIDRAGSLDAAARTWRAIGSPGFPFDEAKIRERAGRFYDRSFYPQGTVRQMAAIMAHGNRAPKLRGVTAPTLVIHGAADPLVPIEGGRDTASSIPGAELLVIEGMGHDLPEGAWPQIVGAISEHTTKAEARNGGDVGR